jgi:hypothetical protein
MKSPNPWITYRTRFLVKAKQLNTSLNFTDVLGRLHSGRKGDYLVESSDGVLRIAPRQIFEDIYVPLIADSLMSDLTMSDLTMSDSTASVTVSKSARTGSPLDDPAGAPHTGMLARQPASCLSKAPKEQDSLSPALISCVIRKSPQPERRRRNSMPGARSV